MAAEFKTSGFILEERNANIVIPITACVGPQLEGTDKILKLFPSLRAKMEALQSTVPPVGTLHMVESTGLRFYFLVTKVRANNSQHVNYLVQAINVLSRELREQTGRWAIAPLQNAGQMPTDVLHDLISGIVADHPAELVFYL